MTECISEGLYRIPVPLPGNPLRELNSYLLRGRERSLLIDTGFRQEEGRRALFAGLAELDVDPRDVDVALTHLHSDHSGLAPEVVGETGWIYVSGPDRAYLEQPEEAKWAHTDAFYISEGFPPELLAQNRANPARALAPVPTGRYRTLEPGAVLEAGGRRPHDLEHPLQELGRLSPGPEVVCRGRVHRPPGPSAPAGTAPARAAGRCVACLGPLTASAGRQRYIFLFFIFSFLSSLLFYF